MADRRNISDSSPYVNTVISHDVISDEVRLIFQWVLYSVISQATNIFGTINNIINIICFVKLGFTDAVNTSLLGLAISDLGCLVTLIWAGICYNPDFNNLDLPFEPIEVQYLTAGGPHIIFARVTSCITAFITLERCLCVTVPLKVKTILTPKRVKVIIASIFVIVFGILVLVYYGARLGEKFSAARNKTLIGTVFIDGREILEAVVFLVGGIFLELGAFATVLTCTIILVIKLRDKTKWRQTSIAPGQTEMASSRDQKVTKMVTVISLLFIVCFFPTCLILVAMVMESELSPVGKYRNLYVCLFSVCFALESINSASNIFIYYHMSSKFKAVLLKHILMGVCQDIA